MKVAFWSASNEIGDVTGYLAAISVFCAVFYKKEVIISRNYLSSRRLEDYFFDSSAQCGKDGDENRYSYGEPEYFRKLWENRYHGRNAITMEGIRLLRPPDLSDQTMFCQKVNPEMLYFMDVSGGANASSVQALEEADLIAVFLPQDMAAVQKFFDNYSSIIPKSVFFIINHRRDNECTPEYLRKIYGIEKEKISVFQECDSFSIACEIGGVEDFIREPSAKNKKSEDYFKHCVGKAARIILGEDAQMSEEAERGYEILQQ